MSCAIRRQRLSGKDQSKGDTAPFDHAQMSLAMDVYAKLLDSDEIASAEAMDAILRPSEN